MEHPHILYNGQCPICSAEIETYRKVSERHGLGLTFEDLNGADLEGWGLSPEDAARRLHVRQGDAIVSGLEAFRVIWARMPRLRWLAWLTGLPGLRVVAHWIYERILAPSLYAMHRLRQRRRDG